MTQYRIVKKIQYNRLEKFYIQQRFMLFYFIPIWFFHTYVTQWSHKREIVKFNTLLEAKVHIDQNIQSELNNNALLCNQRKDRKQAKIISKEYINYP